MESHILHRHCTRYPAAFNATFENFTPISTSWRIPSWLVSRERSTVKWSDCAMSDWVQRDDKQNLFRSLKKMYCGKKDYLDAQHHRYLSTQWSSFVACTLHWGAGRSIGALLSTSWSCLSLMMVQHTCCTLRMLPKITLAAWLNTRFSQSKLYIIPIHPILKGALYSYSKILPTLTIRQKNQCILPYTTEETKGRYLVWNHPHWP